MEVNGNPQCCAIILFGTELKANHIVGVQPWVEADGVIAQDLPENSEGLYKFNPSMNLTLVMFHLVTQK
jgi:hypothetical protein